MNKEEHVRSCLDCMHWYRNGHVAGYCAIGQLPENTEQFCNKYEKDREDGTRCTMISIA